MKMGLTLALILVLGSVIASATTSNTSDNNDDNISYRAHAELGEVHWLRDFEKAKDVARSSGRPMLVLFQEIPGCQTCQNFGKQPLSHPLVVEAIEDQFVPVTIFNNKPGIDEQLLKKFKEPSWNNPVFRFLSADEKEIIGRKDRVWTTQGVTARLIESLQKAGKSVPDYLSQITTPVGQVVETAEFAMHCYWEGEVLLGGIEGVYSTRSGWRGNLEVVQVKFAPNTVTYEQLLAKAMELKCASKVFAHTEGQLKTARKLVGNQVEKVSGKMRDAKASDQKYYLSKTPLRHLPLTEIQATKLNALAKTRRSPEPILSPRQRELLQQIVAFNTSNPGALKQFQFPENQDELGDYQIKLIKALKQTTP